MKHRQRHMAMDYAHRVDATTSMTREDSLGTEDSICEENGGADEELQEFSLEVYETAMLPIAREQSGSSSEKWFTSQYVIQDKVVSRHPIGRVPPKKTR